MTVSDFHFDLSPESAWRVADQAAEVGDHVGLIVISRIGRDHCPVLGALAQHARIPVNTHNEFLRDHKSFLIATIESDYLPQHLTASGYGVTPPQEATTLYHVQAPE
jgi:hypothetical protein